MQEVSYMHYLELAPNNFVQSLPFPFVEPVSTFNSMDQALFFSLIHRLISIYSLQY